MKFHQSTAELFIPDSAALPAALERTSHLAVSAHQDDLEIMTASAILECYQNKEKWFTFRLGKTLDHAADLRYLGRCSQFWTYRFIDGTVAEVESIRLAQDEISFTPFQHRAVPSFQSFCQRA